MKTSTKLLAGGAVVLLGVAATAGAVVASSGDDSDTPITGQARQRASQAAVDHVGSGRVTGTEVGDEDSYYEVEVTQDDGSQVDVQLDENFNVVTTMADNESEADAERD